MNEQELNFFRTKNEGYEPFTPAAALKAFENDIIPIEFFINKSTSVKSIEEKPYDFEAIDRMLAIKDIDIKTTRFLMMIFKIMVKDRDSERALYGAEAINVIESRYNKRIEMLKEKLKKEGDQNIKYELAQKYYELALISEKQKDIKRFFLKIAYYYLKDAKTGNTLAFKNLELLINILLEFNFNKQALSTIKNIDIKHKAALLFLLARVEFKNKHYNEVYKILQEIKQCGDTLADEIKKILEYWIGNNERAD